MLPNALDILPLKKNTLVSSSEKATKLLFCASCHRKSCIFFYPDYVKLVIPLR